MAEVKILEFSDVENGHYYRRKVGEEYEYVTAIQFHGEPGFSVRQKPRLVKEGIMPERVTGGGNGDYIVQELTGDGLVSAIRRHDFERQFERVAVGRLPKGIRETLSGARPELAEAGA